MLDLRNKHYINKVNNNFMEVKMENYIDLQIRMIEFRVRQLCTDIRDNKKQRDKLIEILYELYQSKNEEKLCSI
jgi:hypothetical protein